MNILETIEKFLFAIYGGFVGALFSLLATGNQTGIQFWFLTVLYGAFLLIVLYLLNFCKSKNKDQKTRIKKYDKNYCEQHIRK